MPKILLVEDDLELAAQVSSWLILEKYTVETASDGQDGLSRLKTYDYDLAILDVDLPKLSGFEICRQYRSSGGHLPVLMLTGRDTIEDKQEGLDIGADDYLTKPFHLKELSARLRALMRRPQAYSGELLTAGDLIMDTRSRSVTLGGQKLQLLPREFSLLEVFMRHPQEVISPEGLLNRAWPNTSEASVSTIYTYIKTLRKKISRDSERIQSVYGLGYRFSDES